jgi:hypothetical protein
MYSSENREQSGPRGFIPPYMQEALARVYVAELAVAERRARTARARARTARAEAERTKTIKATNKAARAETRAVRTEAQAVIARNRVEMTSAENI